MNEIDLSKAQREETRWRILRALDVGRPRPVSETILLRTLEDIKLPVTPSELRRELHYLKGLEMVELHDTDSPTWTAALTTKGVDVVEYTTVPPPGIARPRKWY